MNDRDYSACCASENLEIKHPFSRIEKFSPDHLCSRLTVDVSGKDFDDPDYYYSSEADQP